MGAVDGAGVVRTGEPSGVGGAGGEGQTMKDVRAVIPVAGRVWLGELLKGERDMGGVGGGG